MIAASHAGLTPGREDAGMSAALLRSATAMVEDPVAADALAALAFAAADEARAPGAAYSQAELFRFLRQAYHSIERSHSRRRVRDALVTALAERQAQPSLSLGA